MGAQAAALLRAARHDGVPLGEVHAARGPGRLQLSAPAGFTLATVALAHGGCGLAPTGWDGRLHLRLPRPVTVDADLGVTFDGKAPDVATLRHVLGLDDDLTELHDACDRLPELAWVRAAGAGRLLRSPTVWQDLVGALAATNTSYRSTQAMLRALVGDGAFPSPEQVLELPAPTGWGYRTPHLLTMAGRIAGGLDVQAWLDPDLPDADVLTAVRTLPGLGPYAAAQVLPLLGPRPRPPVLDGWLCREVGDLERFRPLGRWAATGAWLAGSAAWLRP